MRPLAPGFAHRVFRGRWRGCIAAVALVLTIALTAGAQARSALANGVPIRIALTYVSGVSNWGPTDAKGDAELSFAEGAVRLEAHGLPQLSGEQYQLWLVKSATNKASSLGTFGAGADGVTAFTGKLNNADGYDYDLLQITVEPLPDTDPAPSLKRSIGGFFTPLQKPSDASTQVAADTQPATLPMTGDAPPAHHAAGLQSNRHTIGLMLIVVGAVVAISAVRRRRPAA